jgi:hypothetical protein
MKSITMDKIKNFRIDLELIKTGVINFFTLHFAKVSADTLGWLAAMLIHFSLIPTLVAAMSGLTDKMPPIDMVLFCWAGLTLLFFKAIISKDTLNILTIGVGFIVQAVMMGLMLFK